MFGGRGKPARFKKNDVVKLNERAPYSHLRLGEVGVVLRVYADLEPSYEIEFVDGRGATLDRLVVKDEFLSGLDER